MIDSSSVEFGRRVKEQRQTQNLTQNQLAAKVGTTQSQISQLENGRSDAISQAIIGSIMEVLELDLETVGVSVNEGYQCGICTNPDCPGGVLGMIGPAVVLRPMMWRIRAKSANRPKCGLCGEIVVGACEECDAPVKPGMFCSHCGHRFVATPDDLASLPATERAAQIEESNRRNRAFSSLLAVENLPIL